MAKCPWKKLMGNIRISGRMRDAHCNKQPRVVDVTHEDLRAIFEKQGGKCYWLGIELDPNDIFVSHHPLAISADRIDNELHYFPENIVICSRFANMGRGQATPLMTCEVIAKIKDSMVSKTCM